MRILVLPANNAPDFHKEAVKTIAASHGHQVVTWKSGLGDSDFDIAVLISGKHNADIIHDLWHEYTPDESLDFDDIFSDSVNGPYVYLGKGLYSFVENTNKPCYLMIAPKKSIDDFLKNIEDAGPAFLRFDSSDTYYEDESDYSEKYGVIDVISVTDDSAYSFNSIIVDNGGEHSHKIDPPSFDVTSGDNITTVQEHSLLLLRRAR